MKYVIYELIKPEILSKLNFDGYHPSKTELSVFKELSIYGIQTTHRSFEHAAEEITENADKLKHLSLTILPVFDIMWDGEIQKP